MSFLRHRSFGRRGSRFFCKFLLPAFHQKVLKTNRYGAIPQIHRKAGALRLAHQPTLAGLRHRHCLPKRPLHNLWWCQWPRHRETQSWCPFSRQFVWNHQKTPSFHRLRVGLLLSCFHRLSKWKRHQKVFFRSFSCRNQLFRKLKKWVRKIHLKNIRWMFQKNGLRLKRGLHSFCTNPTNYFRRPPK